MVDADGRYVLSYNGEIYNFRELRTELEALGLLVPLAQRHRSRAPRLGRMGRRGAASASTACSRSRSGTARERRLLLARDRYGIKPLYYAQQGTAVRCSARSRRRSSPCRASNAGSTSQALLEYFTFQNFFTDRTLFEGVRMLPAGHYAVLDLDTRGRGSS